MSSARYPSLEIVYRELSALLQRQNAHADALDSKASIVIGFTALLLGVSVARPTEVAFTLPIAVGVGFAAASFAAAIIAFWVRSFASLPDPRRFYEEFALSDIEQTQLTLCNLAAAAYEKNRPHIRSKSRYLKVSLLLLSAAVAAVLIGFYLEGAF